MEQCHVCQGPCEADLHKVKVSLRGWFRREVISSIRKVKQAKPRVNPHPAAKDLARTPRLRAGKRGE